MKWWLKCNDGQNERNTRHHQRRFVGLWKLHFHPMPMQKCPPRSGGWIVQSLLWHKDFPKSLNKWVAASCAKKIYLIFFFDKIFSVMVLPICVLKSSSICYEMKKKSDENQTSRMIFSQAWCSTSWFPFLGHLTFAHLKICANLICLSCNVTDMVRCLLETRMARGVCCVPWQARCLGWWQNCINRCDSQHGRHRPGGVWSGGRLSENQTIPVKN